MEILILFAVMAVCRLAVSHDFEDDSDELV